MISGYISTIRTSLTVRKPLSLVTSGTPYLSAVAAIPASGNASWYARRKDAASSAMPSSNGTERKPARNVFALPISSELRRGRESTSHTLTEEINSVRPSSVHPRSVSTTSCSPLRYAMRMLVSIVMVRRCFRKPHLPLQAVFPFLPDCLLVGDRVGDMFLTLQHAGSFPPSLGERFAPHLYIIDGKDLRLLHCSSRGIHIVQIYTTEQYSSTLFMYSLMSFSELIIQRPSLG